MKIYSIMPKVGKPEDYIGKPFSNVEGTPIGKIIACEEIDGKYHLSIETDIEHLFKAIGNVSFSFKEV